MAKYVLIIANKAVVPHVGTWIEILVLKVIALDKKVVPHVGTWIEIYLNAIPNLGKGSCLT